jgi:prolyl oligopeptidase
MGPLLFLASILGHSVALRFLKSSSTKKYSTFIGSQATRNHWTKKDGEHAYLEEVLGDDALSWVRDQNRNTLSAYGNPESNPLYGQVLSILDSKEKIPYVSKIGELYYNFWQDANNMRGLLRRTTLQSYESDQPIWETVLDIDKLGTDENQSWVYKGK